MISDDTIRMMEEAGIEWQKNTGITGRVNSSTCGSQPVEKIERFASLVAAAEREACAQVCDELQQCWQSAGECADAIRARGQA